MYKPSKSLPFMPLSNEQLYIKALKQEYIKLMMYISSQNKEIRRLEKKIEELQTQIHEQALNDAGKQDRLSL